MGTPVNLFKHAQAVSTTLSEHYISHKLEEARFAHEPICVQTAKADGESTKFLKSHHTFQSHLTLNCMQVVTVIVKAA